MRLRALLLLALLALAPSLALAQANQGPDTRAHTANVNVNKPRFGGQPLTPCPDVGGNHLNTGVPLGNIFCGNSTPAGAANATPFPGTALNLTITQTSTTAASVVWDEMVAETTYAGAAYKSGRQSFTLNFGTNGVNGLDTGSLATSSYYCIYGIINPSGPTSGALATLCSTSSGAIYSGVNMPAGYTASGLIGVMVTNSSTATLKTTTQIGREIFYTGIQGITIFSSVVGAIQFTSQSVSNAAPTITKTVSGFLFPPGGGITGTPEVASDASGATTQAATGASSTAVTPILSFRQLPLLSPQTVYWQVGVNTCCWTMAITSFTF